MGEIFLVHIGDGTTHSFGHRFLVRCFRAEGKAQFELHQAKPRDLYHALSSVRFRKASTCNCRTKNWHSKTVAQWIIVHQSEAGLSKVLKLTLTGRAGVILRSREEEKKAITVKKKVYIQDFRA